MVLLVLVLMLPLLVSVLVLVLLMLLMLLCLCGNCRGFLQVCPNPSAALSPPLTFTYFHTNPLNPDPPGNAKPGHKTTMASLGDIV